jgi:hypothetical protein
MTGADYVWRPTLTVTEPIDSVLRDSFYLYRREPTELLTAEVSYFGHEAPLFAK